MKIPELIKLLIRDEEWGILLVIKAKGMIGYTGMITKTMQDDINKTLMNCSEAIEEWRENHEEEWDFDSENPADYCGDVLEVAEEFISTRLDDSDIKFLERL